MDERHREHDIFLLMLNLTQVRKPDLIFTIFLEALNSFWDGVALRLRHPEHLDISDETAIEVATMHRSFGHILLSGDIAALAPDELALIRNSAQMLAILLENRYQEQLLEQENLRLDTLVQERTQALLLANRDLTNEVAERCAAEEHVRSIRNYLKRIIDAMPSMLIGLDVHERITHWNAQAAHFTGVAEASAYQRSLFEAFPELEPYRDAIRQSMQTCTPQFLPKIKFRPQHQEEWYYIDMLIYPMEESGVDGAVIRIDDVTRHVQLEDMMIQAEKMTTVGGLAAGMAHEINNPLGIILQSAQNLRRRLCPDAKKNVDVAEQIGIDLYKLNEYCHRQHLFSYMDGIRDAGERAAKIVANMLEFSHRTSAEMRPVNLNQLLDDTIELAEKDYDLRKRYDFHTIRLHRHYDATLPLVSCNQTEIQQVVLNMLRNSAQAIHGASMARAPQITISTGHDAKMISVSIEDNGPGLEKEAQKRMFEPFFTTKDVGEGTGLGLYISYFIITTHHQGTISVESEAGAGTRITFFLPASF